MKTISPRSACSRSASPPASPIKLRPRLSAALSAGAAGLSRPYPPGYPPTRLPARRAADAAGRAGLSGAGPADLSVAGLSVASYPTGETTYRAIGTEPFWDLEIGREPDLHRPRQQCQRRSSRRRTPINGIAGEIYRTQRLDVNIVHAPVQRRDERPQLPRHGRGPGRRPAAISRLRRADRLSSARSARAASPIIPDRRHPTRCYPAPVTPGPAIIPGCRCR